MSYIRRGKDALSGLAAGFVLLGLAALPFAGCSLITPAPSDDATASALPDSSMKMQGTRSAEHSASEAVASNDPLKPDAQAAAIPALTVPPVTSPTTAALAAAAPMNSPPVALPTLEQPAPGATVVASTGASAINVPSTGGPVLKGLSGNGMQGSAQILNPVMMRALGQFKVASASFPEFCRDWGRKLSVRERDNLGGIKWEMRDGVETGSYVGYGSIDSCTCKEATNGVAVGILTYKEFDYTLTGKSLEEARRATPHAATVVPTREIFAYDKGKWFW